MNAPNPSSVSREFESLKSTQHVLEPSMDDILAEIRRSIMTAGAEPPAARTAPQISGSQVVTDTSISPALAATPLPLAAHLRPQAAAPAVAPQIGSSVEPSLEQPLASPATEAAVAACFDALSAGVAMQGSGMIEGLMREILRPMMKSWLDDHLPGIVERLVSAEIQRVARGGR